MTKSPRIQFRGGADGIAHLPDAQILRFDAGFSVAQGPDCPVIGQPV
jgi:hypothetical protein